MKNLLFPLKRIIFLSFILFTISAGEESGCKCGNESDSSSSNSNQRNSSGAKFGTSGKPNGGNSNSGNQSTKPLSKKTSKSLFQLLSTGPSSSEEAKNYKTLKDNLNNWLNKQPDDTGEKILNSFKPKNKKDPKILEILTKAILNNIGEEVVKIESNDDSISHSYNELFEKIVQKEIINVHIYGAIKEKYTKKEGKEKILFLDTMQVFAKMTFYIFPDESDKVNVDKNKNQAKELMKKLIKSIRKFATESAH